MTYQDNQGNYAHEAFASKAMNTGDMPESFTYDNGEEGDKNITIRLQLLTTYNQFAAEGKYSRSNLAAFFSEAVDGRWRVYSVFDENKVSTDHLQTNNGHIGTVGFFGKSYDYDADISSVTGQNGGIPSYDEDVSGVNDMGDNLTKASKAQEEAVRAFCAQLQESQPDWGTNSIDDFRDTVWSVLGRGEVDEVSVFDDGSAQGVFSVYNKGSFYITSRQDSLLICPTADSYGCSSGASGESVVFKDCADSDQYTTLSPLTQSDVAALGLDVAKVHEAMTGKAADAVDEENSEFAKSNLTKREAR